MKNKVIHKKQKSRAENSFPYLSIPIEQRLAASNNINLTNNYSIKESDNYWSITPKDQKKKDK